jgi:hypothetical protein
MRIAAFTCTLVLLAGCGGSSNDATRAAALDAQRSALDAHRALWADRGPRSYRYTHAQRGFAPHVTVDVTVTSGVVSDATLVEGDAAAVRGATVEALFDDVRRRLDLVEHAAPDQRCAAAATYDETLGYPRRASFGCDPGESDGWDVSGFTSLD